VVRHWLTTSRAVSIDTMETDPGDHRRHDHIGAVFADRASAETAVEALGVLGLGSEHLGVAVRLDDLAFEHDADAELLADTARGAVAGGSIGTIAGIVLAGIVVPGIGAVGAGGLFALAGASTLWGGTIGAAIGAAAGERGWAAHEDMSYLGLEPGEVAVVVCSHGRGAVVRDILRRSGGRPIDIDPARLGAPG
jgi:hypothetical protein